MDSEIDTLMNKLIWYSGIGLGIGLCIGILAAIVLNKVCFKNRKMPKLVKVLIGIVLILGFCALGSFVGDKIGMIVCVNFSSFDWLFK